MRPSAATPAARRAATRHRHRCHRCAGPACFLARLRDTPGSDKPLRELGACGRHFADVVDDLATLARARGLAAGQITLEAVDTAPAQPAARAQTRLLSSTPLATIDVKPAAAPAA